MRKLLFSALSVILAGAVVFAADDEDPASLAKRGVPVSIDYSVAGADEGFLQLGQLELTARDYMGIEYRPNGLVWILGYKPSSPRDQAFWRSTDHGNSWEKKTIAGATTSERGSFAAKDADTLMYATTAGRILRSTDGGTTWGEVFSYAGGFFDGIKFVNGDTVIAFGDADGSGLMVARSLDAGATWTRITNLPAEELTPDKWWSYFTFHQAMDTYGSTVWISLYRSPNIGRILKSTDAGETWDSWEFPLTGGTSNYRFRAIKFMDDSLGFAIDQTPDGTQLQFLHITTDGGMTWSDTIRVEPGVPNTEQQLIGIAPIRGTDSVYLFGGNSTNSSARVYVSGDRGVTWTRKAAPGRSLWNGAFISANQGFAIGYNNAVKFTTKDVVNVTFRLNTATVPDTLPLSGQTVQIRGGVNHAGGFSPITWGNDAQNNMSAIGGDYWQKTFIMQVGDTLRYKYVINTPNGTGWETGVVPADFPLETNANRSFIVPAQDTTLQLEFWNNAANTRPQYFRPWAAVADTFVTVYFRVSMLGPLSSGSYGYNQDLDTLAVRGGGPAGGDLNWSPSFYLTRESPPTDGGAQAAMTVPAASFWSGALRLPKSGLTPGGQIGYKYLIGSDWNRPGGQKADEGTDRNFIVPSMLQDTTLHWVFFNNESPTSRANPDTVRVQFRANLAQAIQSGGFSIGDTLYVRTGYFGTALEAARRKEMQLLAGTIYQATDTIQTARDQLLDYQYYVLRNGTEVRETYFNYDFSGATQAEAERRQVTVPSNASLANTMTVLDTATSITQARRQPVFPNARPLARTVKVTYLCDLRPAYYEVAFGDTLGDIQGTIHINQVTKDSIFTWGVWMNGLAVGDWSNPGGSDWGLALRTNDAKKLYDNGTNGDMVAGDSIYSRIVYASPDSTRGTLGRVGQVFKFGIWGGDNEGGRGGFGNNHNENIVDDDTVYTIDAQFGSINPSFYDHWDYDLRMPKFPTSVIDPNQPLVYELAQNYPNPFNPSTKITYAIPQQAFVSLKVYNTLGQEVVTLVDGLQKAGIHTVRFDATNFATGVYYYRLTADNFVTVKKMMLLK